MDHLAELVGRDVVERGHRVVVSWLNQTSTRKLSKIAQRLTRFTRGINIGKRMLLNTNGIIFMKRESVARKLLLDNRLFALSVGLMLFCFCIPSLSAQTFYVSSGNDILTVNSAGAVNTYAAFNANAQTEGLAVDSSGDVYVGDSNSSTVREVTPAGMLSVFATLPSNPAAVTGLAFDTSGNLYVADGNIFKITSGGTVSIFATLPTNALPQGLAFDSSGNLYAADSNIAQISKITSAGAVSVFASLPANSDPYGLAFDGSGNLYVAGLQTSQISKISSTGVVSTFAALPTNSFPEGLAFDGSGNLYSGDIFSNQISKISPIGTVSTFANNVQNASFLALRPVPEPSTWVILLFTGAMFIAIRWRHLVMG